MLRKRFRLSSKDLIRLKTFEEFVNKKGFFLNYKSIKNDLPYSRFSVSCSLKVHKRSTVRNTLRRRIYSIISVNKLHEIPGWDCLITVKSQAKDVTYANLEREIKNILIH